VDPPRRTEPPRRRAEPPRRIYTAPPPAYRPYAGAPRVVRPRIVRPRIVPYGYRPYGYRPGWSLNLYFGRPSPVYGHRTVFGAAPGAYGYYAVVPGIAYGALRIVDAPRDAHVFVDGYYAGVVDDYDGVFQHLNLEAGSHHIEIELDEYRGEAFDVYIRPGQTITYRSTIY
jgi:hypothetical protein